MDGDEVRPELYFFEKGEEEENKAKEREEMIKKAGVARPSAAGAGSRAALGARATRVPRKATTTSGARARERAAAAAARRSRATRSCWP